MEPRKSPIRQYYLSQNHSPQEQVDTFPFPHPWKTRKEPSASKYMLKKSMHLGIKANQNKREQKGGEGPKQFNSVTSFRESKKHSHYTRV